MNLMTNLIARPERGQNESVTIHAIRRSAHTVLIFGASLTAVSALGATTLNYFKGKTIIPLKTTPLHGFVTAGIYSLCIDGHYWATGKKEQNGGVRLKAIISVALTILTSPFLTYYLANKRLNLPIKRLPVAGMAASGAIVIFLLEAARNK